MRRKPPLRKSRLSLLLLKHPLLWRLLLQKLLQFQLKRPRRPFALSRQPTAKQKKSNAWLIWLTVVRLPKPKLRPFAP